MCPGCCIALTATLGQLAAASCAPVSSRRIRLPDVWREGIGTYSIGGWPAPFGIVLVVDRLSALMITLNAVLALSVLVYSMARWDRLGVHYHPLLQFLLMGLNGAFLTGDLFNLFVFFEILLAASYALLLHGAGTRRVKSALHFIVVNLTATFAFLIGVALIYSVVGTLNMARYRRHAGHRCQPGIAALPKPGPRSSALPSWSRPRAGRSTSGCRPRTQPRVLPSRQCSRSRPKSASMRCCASRRCFERATATRRNVAVLRRRSPRWYSASPACSPRASCSASSPSASCCHRERCSQRSGSAPRH